MGCFPALDAGAGAWAGERVIAALGRAGTLKPWLRALEAIKAAQARPDLTLPALIQELGERHGDRPALLGERNSWSYRELAAQTRHYAQWAGARGMRPGEVVGLLMPNCPEYLAIWLGLTRMGATVALLNTALSGTALLHCINTAECTHVIVAERLADRLAAVRERLPEMLRIWSHGGAGGSFKADVADEPLAAPEYTPRAEDLALLIFTSGTTGLPKAAKVTHGRVMEWSTWFSGMLQANENDRVYNCLPMYHSSGGVVAVGSMLVSGGSVVIRERFSARRFWRDVTKTECTIFQYIGELCRYLVSNAPDAFETRHRLRLCCGNGLRPDVWPIFEKRFRIAQILEFYAATEGNVSLYNCEGKPGAIGRVPPFLSHRFPVAIVKCDIATGEILRDAAGRCVPCAPDESGEAIGKILDTAESQFDGYTDPAASDAKLLRDVFEAGDRWFRTGDLMRKDKGGYYYFMDRLGDSFRWKGENVATTEVAEILSACPGIREALVFGVEVPGNEGKAGMAAIAVQAGFSMAKLQEHVETNLPPYARPMFLRFCRTMATTGTFKPMKEVLRREGYMHAPKTDPVWVYDSGGRHFTPCTAEYLVHIQNGGFGIRPGVLEAA